MLPPGFANAPTVIPGDKQAVRRSAWLGGASLCALSVALLLMQQPAFADGGVGGGLPSAAGGQTDPVTGAATNGADGPAGLTGGGGGGAGTIGGTGGAGGAFQASAGGSGGTAAVNGIGGNGGNGTDGVTNGGGGGGGAHGAVAATFPLGSPVATGGTGGAGGVGNSASGGGGAGGYGAFITGAGGSTALTITGGNGGDGGPGINAGFSGQGGIGVFFATAGATLTNSGSITGGNGGTASLNFRRGAGGAGVVGSGLTIVNSGTIAGGFTGGGGAQANAITFTGGTNTLELRPGSSITGNVVAASSADTFRLGGLGAFFDVSAIGATAQYRGFGNFEATSIWVLTGTTTAVTPWNITGALLVSQDAALGAVSGGLTLNGGVLNTTASFTSNRTVTLNGVGNQIAVDGGTTLNLTGLVTGGGTGFLKNGVGTLILSGANNYAGGTDLTVGTIEVGNNSALGTGGLIIRNGTTLRSGAAGLAIATNVTLRQNATVDTNGNAMTLSGVINENFAGSTLSKAGAGTLILTNNNTYTGTTIVNDGTLAVNGSIASSSLTTVNAGGTLGGNGIVGDTTINAGGTLAPGNSIGLLTVQGNLMLDAAASYLVEVSPANADRTNVTGTATLGGATVNAQFAAGAYVAKQYTILNATGGLGGTTFSSVVNTNLPGGFTSSLSYDTNNAYLNLVLSFVPPPGTGLSANQQNVGNAIVNFFNAAGGIPLVFGGLTPAGLTQISGETATGSQQTTFNAMNQFMGVMTDPFIAGRGDPVSGGGNPNAYAEESLAYAAKRKPNDALAAIYTKAPPIAPVFEQRWSTWAAGYGGSQRTDGDPRVLGSNDTRSSIYGSAVGADYRISPNTLAGFALAGGGTNFSVNGFGSGRSDLFQAGAFIRHTMGAAYLSGALAYGWQDITTDRTVTVAGIDRLRAQFNANAWSGRIEGGYRFVAQGFGWTPYAAGQFTTFELPAYAEQAIVGSNIFALAYNSKSVTATRSELGLRTDRSFAMQDGIFTLRGRAAWAHDYNADRNAVATFQALPGTSFVVNGARQAADAALVTGSAEMKWINGWSVAGTFEGEFSNVTKSYAGKGVVRYAW